MIRLIVFDLWQTLVYRDFGYGTSAEIIRLFHPQGSIKKIRKVFEDSIQTKKWKSEYKAFENLAKNLGLGTEKEVVKLLMSLRDYADSRTKLYPHVIAMLKKLKKQGFKVGILSNSSVFDVKYMQNATHLLKHVDYSIFSYNVGCIKPNKKMYQAIIKKAKCKAEEVIMIGDKKCDDVIPPKKMGMNAIHYKNFKQLKKEIKKYGILI